MQGPNDSGAKIPLFADGQWLWEKNYPNGVSWRMPVVRGSVYNIFAQARKAYGAQDLCDFQGKTYTYEEMGVLVDRVAAGLARLGVRKGDRVGLFLPNTPYSFMFYYGALKIGAVIVNYNPLYTAREVAHQAEDSETDILVTVDVAFLMDKIAEVFKTSRLKKVVVCPLAGVLPFPKNLLYPVFMHKDVARVTHDARHIRFSDLVDNDGVAAVAPIDAINDLAVLQYTGGTTGVPKGAALTHGNLTANVRQTVGWVTAIEPGRDVMLGVLPFFHVFAMTVVMNCAVASGMKVILHAKFDLDELLNSIRRHRPTFFPGVPAIFSAIANSPRVKKIDFSCLKYCMSGGAPLPGEVKRLFEEKTGCHKLAEGYGLSETSPVVAFNPCEGVIKAGSVGMPIPATIIEIIDRDDGVTKLPVGEIGEICISGPQVMKGYHNKPEETAQVLGNGRLRTGDVGYIDAEGYLFIVDRIKDMIIVRGYKVYPRFIEEALHKHPAVGECIVAGVPDAERGETVWAWVRPSEGRMPEEEDLKKFLSDKLSPIEVPRKIIIRDKPLPRTAVGKLDKKALLLEEGIIKPTA